MAASWVQVSECIARLPAAAKAKAKSVLFPRCELLHCVCVCMNGICA